MTAITPMGVWTQKAATCRQPQHFIELAAAEAALTRRLPAAVPPQRFCEAVIRVNRFQCDEPWMTACGGCGSVFSELPRLFAVSIGAIGTCCHARGPVQVVPFAWCGCGAARAVEFNGVVSRCTGPAVAALSRQWPAALCSGFSML